MKKELALKIFEGFSIERWNDLVRPFEVVEMDKDAEKMTVNVTKLPERFDIIYVAEDNSRKRPVMLHRARFGSLERFTGILIEHYAGAFPTWLAPQQAVVMTITEAQCDYAREVVAQLRAAGVRVEADLRNEKIGYKIREHSLQKLPYQIIIGDKEKAGGLVAVRTRTGEDLGQLTLSQFIERIKSETLA